MIGRVKYLDVQVHVEVQELEMLKLGKLVILEIINFKKYFN